MGRASSELALALGICPHCHPLLMSVVYLWLPGLSTIRLFSVHCLFLSQTLAPSQGEEEEGSHGKTFAALLSRSADERNVGGGHPSQRVPLAGLALWPLLFWDGPACHHRALCENVSLQDSPLLWRHKSSYSQILKPFGGFLSLLPLGLDFPSAILTNDLLSCSFSCFSFSPAKAKFLCFIFFKSPLCQVWREGHIYIIFILLNLLVMV